MTSSSSPPTTSMAVEPQLHRKTGTSMVVRVSQSRQCSAIGMWLISSTEPASGVSATTISHE